MGEKAAAIPAASDELLAAAVKSGDQDALALLYKRYAPLVFHLALQSLGAAVAEEIVQDVFFSVWRKAESFDPGRGPFRPWLLQVAHFRVLNELRVRSRRPKLDPDSSPLEELADETEGPVEEAWGAYRRQAVRDALEKLPRSQRQALSLAFFEELSHDQVAEALNIPLGTAKTRIRSGVRKLRRILLPLGIAGALAISAIGLGWAFAARAAEALREGRALSFATASDLTLIHLPAAPGVDPLTHGSYRGRPGTAMAVVALHVLPAAPRGEVYRVWARVRGAWIDVGSARPEAGGDAVVIGEEQALRALPEAVQVRREGAVAASGPSGSLVISWEAPSK